MAARSSRKASSKNPLVVIQLAGRGKLRGNMAEVRKTPNDCRNSVTFPKRLSAILTCAVKTRAEAYVAVPRALGGRSILLHNYDGGLSTIADTLS